MGWTITIGRVAGTEVKVHLTFFILVAFWAMQGYQQGGNAGAWLAALFLLAASNLFDDPRVEHR